MRLKQTVVPVLLTLLFAAVLAQLSYAVVMRASDYEWFDPIVDIRRVLVDEYVEPPDEDAMQLQVIDAMIDSLDDPHTVFIPPSQEAGFQKDLHGQYVGIGAEVTVVDNYLAIVTPMEGSPALDAGIRAGDLILEIEGVSTYGVSPQECIDRLMGKPNTEVTILVRHLDAREEQLTITRSEISTHTVKGLKRRGEEWDFCIDEELALGYVRVTQFNRNTVEDLRLALDGLQNVGLNGLILDLRDNPGGALPSAVDMANLFLPEGMIVSVRDRHGQTRLWDAESDGTVPDFPMIILLNGASASASEIVAGALQDNGRAVVMGTRSYGKGSVQEVRELPEGRGTLKFTSAYYYLPSGRNLHRRSRDSVWGVDPSPGMVVRVSDEEYNDMRLARREFEVIRQRGNGGDTPDCVTAEWVQEELMDSQLAMAQLALQHRVTDGEWPTVTDDEGTQVALTEELTRHQERRERVRRELIRLDRRIGELTSMADEAGHVPLLPEDLDLTDGSLVLRDKHGNLIGEFRIQGRDVALALETLPLSPLVGEDDSSQP